MRSVFVGNLDHNARKSDVERLFGRYGRVARVEMIRGYAFVYLEDERDAAEAIRKLDKCPFGKEKRRLSVAWAKSEHSRPPGDGKANSNQKPSKTLYVTNFDPVTTKEHHIENHFEPYGKVISARITGNFAFVQFATQEDATKALEATRRSKILDRFIVIEYALKYGDQRTDQYAGGSPRRSLSPVYRTRPSPDYDRYKGPSAHERRKSPSAHEKRKSPAPGERRRSPAPDERRRSSAAHERRRIRRRSPAPDERRRSRAPDELRRSPAPDERHRSPAAHERRRSPAAHESRRSPARRSRRSPGDRRRSPAPCERRKSPDYGRRSSDYGRPRSSDDDRHRSRSPVARGRR